MAGQQAEGAKHRDCFTCPPESLVVEDNKGGVFYDDGVEEPLPETFIKNLMRNGVIDPVVVMRDGDRLIINEGRKRRRGLIEANKRLVAAGKEPHLISYVFRQSKSGDKGIIGMSVAGNFHIGDSPMTRARKARRMLDAGATEDEVAIDFGVESAQAVRNWLVLLDLADPIQQAVDKGDLSEAAGRDLAKLDRETQKSTFEKMAAEGTTKGAEAKRAVSAVRKGKEVPKKDTAKRMKNRVWLQEVYDRLETKGALKKDAQAVLAFAAMVLGYRGAEKDQCDDVAEVLDEMTAAKKPAVKTKKQRAAA
jgi:ParB family transcriptional regulator, chromosome partitioning protein